MLLCIYHNKLANSLLQKKNTRKEYARRVLHVDSLDMIYKHVISSTITFVCDDDNTTKQS